MLPFSDPHAVLSATNWRSNAIQKCRVVFQMLSYMLPFGVPKCFKCCHLVSSGSVWGSLRFGARLEKNTLPLTLTDPSSVNLSALAQHRAAMGWKRWPLCTDAG